MPRSTLHAPRFTLLCLFLGLLLPLLFAPLALAHATLVRSDPPPNAVLATSPLEIHLWLSEPLVSGISAITVLDAQGQAVQQGDTRIASPDATELVVALPPLPNGTYLVDWRAFSAVDGHTTEGTFAFSVGAASVETPSRSVSTTNAPRVSRWAVIWRWLSLLAQAALVGMIAFRWWVWEPASRKSQIPNSKSQLPFSNYQSPISKPHSLFFSLCLALAAIAGTALFVSQILSGAGAAFADLIAGRVPLGTVFGSRLGTAWIGRIATLIALAVIAGDISDLTSASPPAPLYYLGSVWLSAQLLLINALGSHSAAIAGSAWLSLPVLADWAHLIGTSIWAGGLLQFVFTVPRALRLVADPDERAELTRQLVFRFSTLAAFGVALMLLSGVYLASLHVARWEHLLDTDYGHALLLKIALVMPMLLLGAANLLWVKPRPEETPPLPFRERRLGGEGHFWRLVTLEALIGILVLAASGLLTELPRGADAAALGPAQLTLTSLADDLRVTLSLAPGRLGANQFNVTLTDAAGRPLSIDATVSLRFVSQDRPLGSREVLLDAQGDGSYAVTDAALGLAGAWQVEVAVRRPGAYDAFAPFNLFVGADGRIA
ncbi:MAG: FixH family protein, partial [Chloroflexi bacterium]|nr:FixH family protein [Chloroflexota bacterium]